MIKVCNVFILFLLAFSCSSRKTAKSSIDEVGTTGSVTAINSVDESRAASQNNDQAVKLCQNKDSRPKAIKIILSSIEKKESVELNFFRLGICFLYAEQYKRAIFNFNRSLFNAKQNTLKSANLHNIAFAQIKLGKYKRALDYLKESSRLGLHPITAYNLGSMQLHLNLFNDQSETYQWLKTRADPRAEYVELLAELALSLSFFDDAVSYYEKLPNSQFEKNSDLVVHYLVALHRINRVSQLKKVLLDKKMFIENNAYYQQMALVYPEIGSLD
jgi:tetratricopeptide (TPR) repeat protein